MQKDRAKHKCSQGFESSGCESGWTAYLDHLSNSTKQNCKGKGEDEDLSMVSDASSGPPHKYVAEEDRRKSKMKSKTKETRMKEQHNVCLDDTASSPMLQFFQEEATAKRDIPFLKSSIKGKSGSLMGRKRQ